MHASTPLARHKSPETRHANRGIALDVRGSGSDVLEPALVRAVLDRWPRHVFPSEFEAVPRRWGAGPSRLGPPIVAGIGRGRARAGLRADRLPRRPPRYRRLRLINDRRPSAVVVLVAYSVTTSDMLAW